ncbi:MAG: hypothetical protein ACRDJT_05335 [Actinomycetota bacterium]
MAAIEHPPLSTAGPGVTHTLGVIASGNVAGFMAGLIVGGVGSRLAMRILSLTSPDAQGAVTEAGEIVGDISLGGTLFLLAAGALLGVGGGLAYVASRRWLPSRGSGLVFGLLMLALSGRLLVDPENLDFVILDPAWLGVAMFASLPVLFGLLVVSLQSRLEPFFTRTRSRVATTLVLVAGLLPLAIGGPTAVVVAVLVAAAFLLARSEAVRDVWASGTVDTLGRAVLGTAGAFGLGLFAWGAFEILI